MDGFLLGLTLAAAVGAGLVGGVFFAFSNFVMKALGRLRPSEGAAAMQSINITVITPTFMTALFGMGLVSLVLIGWGFADLDEPYAGWLHRRRGDLPDRRDRDRRAPITCRATTRSRESDPESDEGARVWSTYLAEWTRMNHVRTVSGLAACALFAVALQAG